ncbi:MAG: aminoacetone oxidase family FAD-binding enzyme [Helicobacteraceae bacterium]|nr:aminoacetone oxidase family FAD-binding enzyme [Helicobacteraceae bacterium]
MYDLVVIGGGASGMVCAIIASRKGKKVLLLEKLPTLGSKLKASGGGRCNLTNTLSNSTFMEHFGRSGKFMSEALNGFDHKDLIEFFSTIGVETHAPDGFRVFPKTHSSSTILNALSHELERLGVELKCSSKVSNITQENGKISSVEVERISYETSNVVIATGALGYPQLGSEGDGYALASALGHTITQLHPAMMPLKCKEEWVANTRADTIAKVELRVDIKKYKKIVVKGDLIFTKNGIRGPVVLDFAREITPLLSSNSEVPILMKLTKGMNEDELIKHFKKYSELSTLEIVKLLLPEALSVELCKLANVEGEKTLKQQSGLSREKLIQTLANTPLTITGHDGFKMAMVTRGGVSLKEINPQNMQSKKVKGLYFCGEVVDLDGPCGGYNLQFAFSSGALVAKML